MKALKVKIKSFTDKGLIEDVEKVIIPGRGYVLKAIDESILKHKEGDNYTLNLSADEAYGHRTRELIKMIPSRFFRQNNITPYKGLVVNIDNLIGKIISVGPGRVLVDFNHPLAGKDLKFEISIDGKVSDKLEIAKGIIKSLLNEELSVKEEGENIVINDTIGLPENIKEKISLELKEGLGLESIKNIKFISKK